MNKKIEKYLKRIVIIIFLILLTTQLIENKCVLADGEKNTDYPRYTFESDTLVYEAYGGIKFYYTKDSDDNSKYTLDRELFPDRSVDELNQDIKDSEGGDSGILLGETVYAQKNDDGTAKILQIDDKKIDENDDENNENKKNEATEENDEDEEDDEYDKDEDEIYSIESIVYNKVPLFDVNVFSDTSAGVKIADNSIEAILKKTVATWYVAFRNVTFVILAILIIYTGMMMAISTVAEEKAKYKERLIGWIKGIIAAAFIHYGIYIIINLNQNIVNTIANSSGKENQIYNPIKTRAMDVRFSIGLPATILYLTLVIMWLRFIWTYIKRKFNVEFLIILAPLVVAKYTYELSSGKKSKILGNWFQRFTTAVFIQSIHALFYTVFVSTALEISTENLMGFVLALMVMNFMLSADKIFTGIFKFNFSGKDIDDLDRPFKPREDLADLYISYSIAKRTIPRIANLARGAEHEVAADASSIYNTVMDGKDARNGKDNRAIIRNKLHVPGNAIDNFLLKNVLTKNSQNFLPFGKTMRQIVVLKKIKRNARGDAKLFAKRTLKMKYNQIGRRFTSGYKFIKDVTVGGVETIFAIPIGVNFGVQSGIIAGTKVGNNFMEATSLASKKSRDKERKYGKQLDGVIKSAETVYEEENKVSKKVSEFSDSDKQNVKDEIKLYAKLGMDKYKIQETIKEEERKENIIGKTIYTNADINKITNALLEQFPEDISQDEKNKIRDNIITTVEKGNSNNNSNNSNNSKDYNSNSNNNNNNYNYNSNNSGTVNFYGRDEVIDGISHAIIKYSFGEEHKDIGESIEKISSINSKESAKKNSFGKLIDINHFADTL